MQNFFDFLSVLSVFSLGTFVLWLVVLLMLPRPWQRKYEGFINGVLAISLILAMISPVMMMVARLSNFLF